jgi:hypothetical protein
LQSLAYKMSAEKIAPLVVAGVNVGFTLFTKVPDIGRLGTAARKYRSTGPIALKDLYQDEDGAATLESEAAFSDQVPKFLFYLASIVGFAASTAAAVIATVNLIGQSSSALDIALFWLNFGVWV